VTFPPSLLPSFPPSPGPFLTQSTRLEARVEGTTEEVKRMHHLSDKRRQEVEEEGEEEEEEEDYSDEANEEEKEGDWKERLQMEVGMQGRQWRETGQVRDQLVLWVDSVRVQVHDMSQ